MLRFYLMPMTVTPTRRVEKYRTEMLDAGIRWQAMAYGAQSVFLIGADVDDTQHALLAAHADVTVFGLLDAQLSGGRNAMSNALESYNIPGAWLTASDTYRGLVRAMVGMILIAQRFRGLDTGAGTGDGNLFPAGVTLNTTQDQMPADYRTRLLDACVTLGYSLAALSPQWSLRQLLRDIGGQQSPIQWLGIEV